MNDVFGRSPNALYARHLLALEVACRQLRFQDSVVLELKRRIRILKVENARAEKQLTSIKAISRKALNISCMSCERIAAIVFGYKLSIK